MAQANVSCPPAVPIVMCGEEIGEDLIPILRAYGTENVEVIK